MVVLRVQGHACCECKGMQCSRHKREPSDHTRYWARTDTAARAADMSLMPCAQMLWFAAYVIVGGWDTTDRAQYARSPHNDPSMVTLLTSRQQHRGFCHDASSRRAACPELLHVLCHAHRPHLDLHMRMPDHLPVNAAGSGGEDTALWLGRTAAIDCGARGPGAALVHGALGQCRCAMRF